MTAIKQIQPVYENRHTTLDEDGNVVLSEDGTVYEILERLNSAIDEYIFDEDYGSRLSRLLNSKNDGSINNATIDLWVRESLAPMVKQGKIKSNIKTVSYITPQFLRVTIYATNIKDKPVVATFRSFLIGGA